tara:strand:- start:1663 stop:1938 length:276 start_codon:yes stop_codon:yes gene_type:complete
MEDQSLEWYKASTKRLSEKNSDLTEEISEMKKIIYDLVETVFNRKCQIKRMKRYQISRITDLEEQLEKEANKNKVGLAEAVNDHIDKGNVK